LYNFQPESDLFSIKFPIFPCYNNIW